MLNLEDIVFVECVLFVLKIVYNFCFKNFYNGKFGAVNGVLFDGFLENFNVIYFLEVWIGINFGLAVFMV